MFPYTLLFSATNLSFSKLTTVLLVTALPGFAPSTPVKLLSSNFAFVISYSWAFELTFASVPVNGFTTT